MFQSLIGTVQRLLPKGLLIGRSWQQCFNLSQVRFNNSIYCVFCFHYTPFSLFQDFGDSAKKMFQSLIGTVQQTLLSGSHNLAHICFNLSQVRFNMFSKKKLHQTTRIVANGFNLSQVRFNRITLKIVSRSISW